MKKNTTVNITLGIFIGLVSGALLELFMPSHYVFLLPAAELFSGLYMNALRMMIYPLVFCSLIVGIQGIASVGATCCNVPDDIARSVAVKQTVKLDAANAVGNKNKQEADQYEQTD